MLHRSAWTLNKLVVLLLAGTFLGLFVDLRYEHVDKLRHFWEPWIPISYSGAMAIACLTGLLQWDRGGRQALLYAFALCFVVGPLGFWLHNQGHPIRDVATMLAAWTRSEHLSSAPPFLAPLSFCLFGVLGMLVCASRFQPVSLSQEVDLHPRWLESDELQMSRGV